MYLPLCPFSSYGTRPLQLQIGRGLRLEKGWCRNTRREIWGYDNLLLEDEPYRNLLLDPCLLIWRWGAKGASVEGFKSFHLNIDSA